MKILAWTVTAAVLAALPGCIIVASDRHYYPATKKELDAARQVDPGAPTPSIRNDYKDQLAKLGPGSNVDAFKTQFPSAIFVEQKTIDGHNVDAYSVKMQEPYHVRGENCIQTAHDEAWFFFKDGQYVKWGEPNEWPK
jgi:hypothetical protein